MTSEYTAPVEDDDVIKLKEQVEREKDRLKIENLVFAGGGVKGFAYCGAIEVLEQLGLLEGVHRFAGSSLGGLAAAALAVGCSAKEVTDLIFSRNQTELIYDSTLGKLALLPNMVTKFGWNPGDNLLRFVQDVMKKKMERPDLTFMELYQQRGVELCIVVTNVSSMAAEYCHPKTTPDLSIALAVRTSMSLPGWYLSMKRDDSFFHRLGTADPAFGDYNDHTLGLRLYTASSTKTIQANMEMGRFWRLERPDTKLAKERAKASDKLIKNETNRHLVYEAGRRFVEALRKADLDRDGRISLSEYTQAFIEKQPLSKEDSELLFGENFDMKTVFDEIDTDSNGQLTADEFLAFMQKKGVLYRSIMINGGGQYILRSLGEFLYSTLRTIRNWAGQVYIKPQDADRTMSLFVDYLDTTDLDMSHKDKEFCLQVGRTTAYHWIKCKLDNK